MAESAVLVPVPFYPPVRYGTDVFQPPHHLPVMRHPSATLSKAEGAPMDGGLVYCRNGRLHGDDTTGVHVNVYI